MAYRSITQIVLILIAVVVIFTYVQPKMTEIGVIQDEVAQYEEAVNRATEFNQLLSSLLSQSAAFSQEEIRALERYLPSEQDAASVARDLSIVANQANVAVRSIALDEALDENLASARSASELEPQETFLVTQNITVAVSGTYSQAKEFVRLVENNAYPLELISFDLGSGEGELAEGTEEQYTFTLIYETYSLPTQI